MRCHAECKCDAIGARAVKCSAVHQIENEVRTERKRKPSDMIVTNDERCMI